MTPEAGIERITDRDVLERHLDALVALDGRLSRLRAYAGEVPLRLSPAGFAGLARIVNAQLLSVASAAAIQARFEGTLGEVSARTFIKAAEADMRACGLSAAKYQTMRSMALAELGGRLDYHRLHGLPAETAIAELTALKGVGRWTAEIYLLFCTGHPDIFPAGDLVLRKMAGYAAGQLDDVPDARATGVLAGQWAPYRGAAALLLWQVYAVLKKREGILI